MGLTAKDIAKALGDSSSLGDGGYKCRCPAHQDDKGSLSVKDSRGRILVRCHASCSQESVIDALRDMDLWPKAKSKASWEPIVPVPVDLPPVGDVSHYKHGKPTRSWVYRSAEGHPIGHIFRFEETDASGKTSKTTLPMAWCESDDKKKSWQWKSFGKPRPLYGLDRLAARPKAPVLVLEGEKSVDAATRLFPEFVCVCWPGGTKAVKYADFKPLTGRDVALWPDADEVGRTAMNQAAEILFVEGATRLRMVDVPERLDTSHKGWDVADAAPDGIDVQDMLKSAGEYTPGGEDIVVQMNRRYAFVLLGGKGAVLRETPNEAMGRVDVSYLAVEGFNQFFSNSQVPVGRGFVPAGKFWMTHKERRTYEGITFAPGRNVPGHYNLWRGFSTSPDPKGDWSMFRQHLFDNAALGNQDHYDWIFGWFAQIFQQPSVKTATSLSFRGKQGTGKTIIGKIIGHLIRSHYTLIADSRYLFGNFNSHMASTILLHSDESFWGGDPRNIGKLKALVSSDTHRVEYKTRDSIEIENFARLLITTNEDWVVPAAAEERRFAVFDMGLSKIQDVGYFVEMLRQLRDGGYSGLLHDLLTFDLSKVEIHKIPDTAALRDQKQTSMSDVAKFWMYCLTEGEILPGHNLEWPAEVSSQRLYDVLLEHLTKWGSRYRPTNNEFMRELREIVPDGSLADCRRLISGKKHWCLALPDLDKAREFVNHKFGTGFQWKVDATPQPEPKFVDDEIPF